MRPAAPVSESRRLAGRVLLGLALATLGGLLLADNLGSLPFRVDGRLWPAALTVMAVARMVERGALAKGPHLLAMLSLALLAGTFEREDLLLRWWPLAVVWAGVLLTLRALFAPPRRPAAVCQDRSEVQP